MTWELDEALSSLPPVWPRTLLGEIRSSPVVRDRSLVVLDDDPTGTQTVYDLPVLAKWDVETLSTELAAGTPTFYILTNSRSVDVSAARAMAREIGSNLVAASRETGRDFSVVSRSDSTLRGHFPEEVDALAGAVGLRRAVRILAPFFYEGGRLTINDVHYVLEDNLLIPAAETPFAQDPVFGYRSSNLRQWVNEKTRGAVSSESVQSISIEDLRRGGPEEVAQKLMEASLGGVSIVNAASYRDMEVAVAGLIQVEEEGVRFVYRTAASFVRVRAGLEEKPLLVPEELDLPEGKGGLVVVGSFVPRTTRQLEDLLQKIEISQVEIEVNRLLVPSRRRVEIERVRNQIEDLLEEGRDVVLYTSRRPITGHTNERNLSIGRTVSASLVEVVRSCRVSPRYLITKGGITSSDLACSGLGASRCWVMGQILPGIPVWRVDRSTKWDGMILVVFAGNVGRTDSLTNLVRQLSVNCVDVSRR